jgi:hypothetical protein
VWGQPLRYSRLMFDALATRSANGINKGDVPVRGNHLCYLPCSHAQNMAGLVTKATHSYPSYPRYSYRNGGAASSRP